MQSIIEYLHNLLSDTHLARCIHNLPPSQCFHSFLLIERVRKVVWRGKRSFLSFFAQLYSYSSVAFVIFWILSLRPTLSGFKWAQRVPLGCFVGWYSRRWSLWIVLVCWCRLWWSHCLCRFGLHGARGWCQSLTFPYVLYQFCFQSV